MLNAEWRASATDLHQNKLEVFLQEENVEGTGEENTEGMGQK